VTARSVESPLPFRFLVQPPARPRPPYVARKGRLLPPIPGEWIIQGGAALVLLIGVLMMFRGHLVPLRVVKALERDRDYWREAALKSMGHTDALMPAAEIATQITKSFSEATTAAIEGRKP
jgi:hypothetical protein